MSDRIRWIFEADFPAGKISKNYVKSMQKKNNELTTAFLNTDINEQTEEEKEWQKNLYKVIASIYDFAGDSGVMGRKEGYEDQLGTITLQGWHYGLPEGFEFGFSEKNRIEKWTFTGAWPVSINFGYLDYNTSSEFTYEVTWKYDKEEYIE